MTESDNQGLAQLAGASAITTRHFVMDDGIKLAADVGGDPDAPAVILLHGGGQTRHSWDAAMRSLVAKGYHVVNYDARGHGESEWSPDGDYSDVRRGDDLIQVLKQVRGPAVLVGASMGGMGSIQALARTPPPAVRALVLVDIVPRPAREGTDKILNFMRGNLDGFATVEEAADAVAAYNPHRPRPSDTSGLLKNLRQRGERLHWHWDPSMLRDMPKPGVALDSTALLEKCRQIKVPMLLVRGLASDVVADEGVEELRQAAPQLEVFEVSGAGHMVAGDRNDAFNEGVFKFLQRHHPLR